MAQLFYSHPAWYYGLFRREAIEARWREVVSAYPYVWGADVVTLFSLQFDRKIIGTNATTFYQYIRFPPPRRDKAQRVARDQEKLAMGRSFMAFAHQHVKQAISNPAERWFYNLVVAYFVHKHGYSLSKRLRDGWSDPWVWHSHGER